MYANYIKVVCLMLKRRESLGYEILAQVRIMNPYMQCFCDEAHFHNKFGTHHFQSV